MVVDFTNELPFTDNNPSVEVIEILKSIPPERPSIVTTSLKISAFNSALGISVNDKLDGTLSKVLTFQEAVL